MFKFLLVSVMVGCASAFAPVGSADMSAVGAARSDAVMMAAKKGVNPALFSTGIRPKEVAGRGASRKSFRDNSPKLNAGAAAGMWVAGKPWLEANKKANAKVSKFQGLAGSLGSKEGRGGGAGIFFLGGGRSR